MFPYLPFLIRDSKDWSRPLVTCTGNPCQSTGTSSPVSTGDLPVLPLQVTNGPGGSSGFLIEGSCLLVLKDIFANFTLHFEDTTVTED